MKSIFHQFQLDPPHVVHQLLHHTSHVHSLHPAPIPSITPTGPHPLPQNIPPPFLFLLRYLPIPYTVPIVSTDPVHLPLLRHPTSCPLNITSHHHQNHLKLPIQVHFQSFLSQSLPTTSKTACKGPQAPIKPLSRTQSTPHVHLLSGAPHHTRASPRPNCPIITSHIIHSRQPSPSSPSPSPSTPSITPPIKSIFLHLKSHSHSRHSPYLQLPSFYFHNTQVPLPITSPPLSFPFTHHQHISLVVALEEPVTDQS